MEERKGRRAVRWEMGGREGKRKRERDSPRKLKNQRNITQRLGKARIKRADVADVTDELTKYTYKTRI